MWQLCNFYFQQIVATCDNVRNFWQLEQAVASSVLANLFHFLFPRESGSARWKHNGLVTWNLVSSFIELQSTFAWQMNTIIPLSIWSIGPLLFLQHQEKLKRYFWLVLTNYPHILYTAQHFTSPDQHRILLQNPANETFHDFLELLNVNITRIANAVQCHNVR